MALAKGTAANNSGGRSSFTQAYFRSHIKGIIILHNYNRTLKDFTPACSGNKR